MKREAVAAAIVYLLAIAVIVHWLLTKGNPTPDGWQVSANGVAKTGSF